MTCSSPFLLPIILLLFIFVKPLNAKDDIFIRQPPGKVIITPHHRPVYDPQQVHISLAGRDYMKISWITENHAPSMVEYGKVSGRYESSAKGEHKTYQYFFYTSGKIHHVKIGPLMPATTYYYRCGGLGPEFNFKTPPSTFPIEFAVAGDLGQTEWTSRTLIHINSKPYDVFLLPGDLSYADTQQPLWDSFGRLVEPYASQRPWMVTEGNHEIEVFPIIYPGGFMSYNSRWEMPYKESESKSNLYYSFDVVGTHVVMLGSYADFHKNSDQYKWVEKDLSKIDRKKTPWLVAVIHAPWYNTNSAHQGEGESMRNAMEELLYRARVDIVFAGHVHAYERFTRVYDNKADPCGAVHVTIGDGGNREGLALMFDDPKSPLSMYREPSFGHGRLKMLNRTHLHWSWHRNNDSNSFVADQFVLHSLSSSTTCMPNLVAQESPSSSVDDEL